MRAKSGALVRMHVSHVCRWVSMKPGITMSPSASITRAPSALRPRPTSAMRSPSTRTSAPAISPRESSWVRTVALRMRIRSVTAPGPFLQNGSIGSGTGPGKSVGGAALPRTGALSEVDGHGGEVSLATDGTGGLDDDLAADRGEGHRNAERIGEGRD